MDFVKELLAPRGAEFFGVGQPADGVQVVQDDGGGKYGAR